MKNIWIIVSWLVGTVLVYKWLMRVGKLRDRGMGWLDATIKENDLRWYGVFGLAGLILITYMFYPVVK